MSRHETLRKELDRLELRRDELLGKLVDVEVRARRKRASLRRSLSAQASGVRPPNPKQREHRAQDEGEALARASARGSRDELRDRDRASKAAQLERAPRRPRSSSAREKSGIRPKKRSVPT